MYVRLSTDVPSPGTVHENDTSLVVDIPTAKNSIWVGDTVLVKWSDKVATVAVTAINGTEFTLKAESGDSIAFLYCLIHPLNYVLYFEIYLNFLDINSMIYLLKK